jgi:nucleoside-diphosphate-sugar epimerase
MRPLPGDDPKQREPKIERAEKLLGWKPKVERHSGLNKTIEYFKEVIAS